MASEAGAQAVTCGRPSIVPLASDWKVLALDLPLAISDGTRRAIIERDHDRARYILRQATMTDAEHAQINAFLGTANAELAKAPRVRRPDIYEGQDLMQLDCQDVARLLLLDDEAPNQPGDWVIYGRDADGDGQLGCREFNYTARVIAVDDEGATSRVMGRDGRTGPVSTHHPLDPEVLEQFGAMKRWYRAR